MNNVKLIKAKPKGWLLIISDENIQNRLAVTSLELYVLQDVIKDNLKDIQAEIEEEDNE